MIFEEFLAKMNEFFEQAPVLSYIIPASIKNQWGR
jgi:hypothetical protein